MNAMIRKISGTFDVVNMVPDEKLDELAALLGLDAEATAQLKRQGTVILVQDSDGNAAGG
jgi:hypothetical protein